MTRPSFLRSRTVLALLLLPVLTLAVACGGGGGSSSPTDPGSPSTPLGSASVSGEIDVAGGGSGNLSSGLSSISGAGQSGAGVTVRIQGTDLSTTADAAGSFRLDGVPHGNQVVVFETSAASAGVPVDSIQPQEAIEIDVELEGSNARVKKLQRNGGTEGEGPDELHLSLQLSPNTWNTNYDHSAGTVTAFIRGEGFTEVILDSIVMVGDDGMADAIDPVSSTREGNHVRTRWAKRDVMDILDDPEPGSTHQVCLEFEAEGFDGTQVLCGDVRIVGPGEDDGEDDEEEDEELGNLSLQVSPKNWNLNYDGSAGTITVFIRGDGLDHIDTDSIELEGDNPAAAPLPADFARLEGNHVRAQFPKNQLLDLLDEPEKNSTHTVIVRFTADDGAESHDLTEQVKVVGNGK
jgi:hypothetical protein